MNCPNCKNSIPNDVRFCPNCGYSFTDSYARESGHPLNASAMEDEESNHNHGALNGFVHGVNHLAGLEEPKKLKLRSIFSESFKKHPEEEAEKLFIVGTSVTTPDISQVIDTWPKPWLFVRVFMWVMIAYIGMYIGLSVFGNLNFLPGLIIVGAFMVPFTLLVFFWEMNAPQNIPIYRVVYIVFIGGIASLIAALILYQTLRNFSGVLIIGFVEEAAKVIAVAWFLRKAKTTYILNGLLIGAAVGTGFAAFETAGYALRVLLETSTLGSLYSTILWRGILAPGGHIVWAALSGAALCLVKGTEDWRWSMLLKGKFLRIFFLTVLLHALWDLLQLEVLSIPILQIFLTVLSWVIAFGMINAGLKQITRLKQEASAQVPLLDETALPGTSEPAVHGAPDRYIPGQLYGGKDRHSARGGF